MAQTLKNIFMSEAIKLSSYVAGNPIESTTFLEVRSPYDQRLVGTVGLADAAHTKASIEAGLAGGKKLTRYERYLILDKTRQLLIERKDEFAKSSVQSLDWP